MRPRHLLILVPLMWIGGCQPLEEPPELPATADLDLVPLDSIPLEWGRLVAVTPHVDLSGFSQWYEMWFSEPASGRIRLVPVYRPKLTYDPSLVTVIERAPATVQSGP